MKMAYILVTVVVTKEVYMCFSNRAYKYEKKNVCVVETVRYSGSNLFLLAMGRKQATEAYHLDSILIGGVEMLSMDITVATSKNQLYSRNFTRNIQHYAGVCNRHIQKLE